MKLIRRLLGRVTVSSDARRAPPAPKEESPARATRRVHLGAPAAGGPERLRGRLSVIGLVLAGAFAVTGARAVEVAVFDATPPSTRMAASDAEARRAMILDRDGEILASTLDFHTVYADPAYIWDPEEVADRLVGVLPDLDRDRLLERLSSDTRYVLIADSVSPRTRQAIHMLGLAGVFFRSEPGRVYPKQRAAAHLVGFAGRGGRGLTGAELAFDAELSEGAGPVFLSIDLTAQHRVESVLRRRMAEHQAAGASAILMRVGTGEVIAMTSLPDFDPNHYLSVQAPPGGSGRIDPRFNQATSGVYELGSVFKPLALAAGLESGRVHLDDVFDAGEPVRIGGHVIRDYRGEDRPLTAREVILSSSNIGAARMADQIGADVLTDFYRDLRLFEPAPIELAESGAPQLPRRWGRIQTMTASYGHGLAVSPLALTAAYAALANGGVYVAPTLRPVAPGETVVGESVMSPSVAAQVLGVLRENVVRSQTGSADVPGLAVAGKTGTAERAVAGGYAEDSRFNTFVAVFPFDDPQYVLTVSMDRPRPTEDTHGFATAGWTAMPAAGEIMAQLAGVLDLERREADPTARASNVEALFAPRGPVRAPVEEPVALPGEAGQ
ncbi:MAG: penicillin-binding protein 2 [Alphaproteobacteria bacterium]|nr:penicillin-binding protein 2 [Alphaproteobacteria bacterium]